MQRWNSSSEEENERTIMKGVIVAILTAIIASPTAWAFRQPDPILARVTVYWASGGRGSDRYTRHHKCATGMRLRDGHCAVDPAKIPYGSHIIFPDGTKLAAVDTGTAVRNRKAARLLGKTPSEKSAVVIDRFFETKRQALAWANTHPHFIPVRVVSPTPNRTQAVPIALERKRTVSSPSNIVAAQTVPGPRGAMHLPKIH